MIVVLVPKASPASVFEATREQIALTVKDTSATGSYVASIPPGLAVGEFEGAWMAMTRDMIFARYFESLEVALKFLESPPPALTQHQFASVVDGLQRMATKRVKRRAFQNGVPGE